MFCDQFVLCQKVQKKKIWLISTVFVLAFRHSCNKSDNEFSFFLLLLSLSIQSNHYNKKKKEVSSFFFCCFVLRSNDGHFMRHVWSIAGSFRSSCITHNRWQPREIFCADFTSLSCTAYTT